MPEKYRYLIEGEIIETNDEMKHRNKWINANLTGVVGMKYETFMKPFRRKISLNC